MNRPFPVASVILFILGAVILRAFCVLAWAFFPSDGLFPQAARVIIPLIMAAGLVVLNRILLRRDGFPQDCLGLGLRQAGWFLAGGAFIAPVILLMAAALWLFVPFHWEEGSLSWSRFTWQAVEYFAGNSAEELMFRGYLLLVLTRHLGLNNALLIVAVLFGVFHLPGLSGWVAVKMICTTALWSYLFAYGYLITGTLWTAVGMHVLGNLLLHQGLGMSGGAALVQPVFPRAGPSSFDPSFTVWVLVSGLAIVVAVVYRRRFPMPMRVSIAGAPETKRVVENETRDNRSL